MTSLGGKDLQERHPKNSKLRSHHVPIHPSNAHPDNGMRLYLIDNQKLPKNSYVQLKPRRTIKAALLKPWKHEKYQLSAKSLKTLKKHIGFKSPWPSTIHVRQPCPSPPPEHNPWTGLNSNRTPPAIPYTPKYQRPVGWASPQDQRPVGWPFSGDWPAHLQPSNARIPLMQPVHRPVTPQRNVEFGAVCALIQLLISVFVLAFLAWYFNMFR
jgi:hypothetical protein